MNYKLTPKDFPLVAIGAAVYRRTLSSPLCVVADERLSSEIATRLNMTARIGVGGGLDGALGGSTTLVSAGGIAGTNAGGRAG